MLKKLLNADDLNKSGSGKKGVEEIYKPNDQLKGFDLDIILKIKIPTHSNTIPRNFVRA